MGRLINSKEQSYAISSTDLKYDIPLWDYHLHTSFTDGKNTVEEMVKASVQKKLTRIIFTEHTEPWLSKHENWFNQYVDEINFCKKRFSGEIEILMGLEAPAIDLNDGLMLTEEMDRQIEYLLGAAHRYPGMGSRKVSELTPDEAVDFEFRTLMALANNQRIDAIAHIGATCSKYVSEFPADLTRKIVRQATKNGIAIEINHHYHSSGFFEICLDEKAMIVLGSNAHKAQDVGIVSIVFNEKFR